MPISDASINYGFQNQNISPKSKRIGATILGGLVGMSCYYLPISKDTFVNTSFRVVRNSTENDIKALKEAADEITKNKLSNENKILLRRFSLSETVEAIADKCKELKESITDSAKVKALKKEFADNFLSYKKDASLMDPMASKAMSTIKWNGFKWGMLIGALFGAALSLLATRDKN